MAHYPSSSTQHEEQTITPTKEALLNSLEDVENELKKIHHIGKLGERLQELRSHVKNVLENQEKQMEILSKKIKKLEDDVKTEKAKNRKLDKMLALAEATWAWEKHLARFVVPPSKKIYLHLYKKQMEDYLNERNTKQNLLQKIRNGLNERENKNEELTWEVIKTLRDERNVMAHPDLINLDFVESEIKKIHPNYQELLGDMLDELKMTASLMKFGRLAKHMYETESMHGIKWNERAMVDIISWDREFEDIDGLQNIEHDEAKKYLEKYVDDPSMIQHYFFIVDSIHQINRDRLGKMAWEIESKSPEGSKKYDKVLSYLKAFLPTDRRRKSPKGRQNLSATIAKLHVPDFLPKDLWKDGIKLVEEYIKPSTL